MTKESRNKLLIQIARIVPAAAIGYYLARRWDLGSVWQVILFFGLYMLIALFIESVRQNLN